MKLYCIAGEASGDLHGKNLLRALKARVPNLQTRGFGGDGMQAEGMHLIRHVRETSFMGFSEVLRNLGTIRKLFREVKADILREKPDAILLIDYPGFNLRMARFCKQHGFKVIYYISPTVWAWKKRRVEQVRKYVDRMLVILPFEKPFYAKEGVEVDFVGHPLLDETEGRREDPAAVRRELGIPADAPIVALLPGSRKQELTRMLPAMLETARHFPHVHFVIAGAPTQPESLYRSLMGDSPAQLVFGRTYGILSAADAALVCSGTATLETALFRVPEVVCYAAPPISVWIARRLIHVKYISLVNLILDREAVRELIQQDMTVANLRSELGALLEPGPRRTQVLHDYDELCTRLGTAGASAKAADALLLALNHAAHAG